MGCLGFPHGAPEGDRSAIGEPEICDRDRLVIEHQSTALVAQCDSCECSCYTSDLLFPYRSPSPRPHPDPTQRPENGAETDPKRSQTEPNRPETDRNGAEIEPSGVGP